MSYIFELLNLIKSILVIKIFDQLLSHSVYLRLPPNEFTSQKMATMYKKPNPTQEASPMIETLYECILYIVPTICNVL